MKRIAIVGAVGAGKTTLFTTVLICSDAVSQVPSIAPATSPLAAYVGTQNTQAVKAATQTSIMSRFIFIVLISLPFRCCKKKDCRARKIAVQSFSDVSSGSVVQYASHSTGFRQS